MNCNEFVCPTKKCDGTKILKKFETFSGLRIDQSTPLLKKYKLYLILILPYVQYKCMFSSRHSWLKEQINYVL